MPEQARNGTPSRIPFATKSEWVTSKLREAILSRNLKPGDRLRQEDLAKRYGVSCTPVREAIRQLEAEGLVQSAAHRGVDVVGLEIQDCGAVRELIRIRCALEGLAVEMAVPNLTLEEMLAMRSMLLQMDADAGNQRAEAVTKMNYEFHAALYGAARAPTLLKLIRSLWARVPWGLLLAVPGRAQQSAQEHWLILRAAEERDANAASAAMQHHIQNGGELALLFAADVKVTMTQSI